MRSGYINFSDRNKLGNGKAPSLVDLCVQVAIDNVRYIGNVGETDSHLLERILPHCTVEQLMHIENATAGRDLSQVTDKLWKKFYEAQFGVQSVELLVKNMAKKKVTWAWRLLYQAKLKQQNEDQKIKVEEMAKKFREENARRQSKQIRIVTKVPPKTHNFLFYPLIGLSLSLTLIPWRLHLLLLPFQVAVISGNKSFYSQNAATPGNWIEIHW